MDNDDDFDSSVKEILRQEIGPTGIDILENFLKEAEKCLSLEELSDFEDFCYENIIDLGLGIEKAENVADRVKKIRLLKELKELKRERKSELLIRKKYEILRELGDISLNLNQLREAENFFDRAYRLTERTENYEMMLETLESQAELYLMMDREEEVEKRAKEMIKKASEIGDDVSEAKGIRLAGISSWRKQDFTEGLNYLDRALKIFEENDLFEEMAKVKRDLGDLHVDKGDLDKAIEFYQEAVEDFEECGRHYEKINLLMEIGMILSEEEAEERVIDLFEKAKEDCEKHSFDDLKSWCFYNLGELILEYGGLKRAGDLLKKSIDLFENQNDLLGLAGANMAYARLKKERNEFDDAEDYYKKALDLFQIVELPDSKVAAMYELSEVQVKQGKLKNAKQNLDEALGLADSMDMREMKRKIENKLNEL